MNPRIHPLDGEAKLPEREVRWCLYWLDHGTNLRWSCPRGGTVGLLSRDMRVFERRYDEDEGLYHAWEVKE